MCGHGGLRKESLFTFHTSEASTEMVVLMGLEPVSIIEAFFTLVTIITEFARVLWRMFPESRLSLEFLATNLTHVPHRNHFFPNSTNSGFFRNNSARWGKCWALFGCSTTRCWRCIVSYGMLSIVFTSSISTHRTRQMRPGSRHLKKPKCKIHYSF